MYPQQPFVEQGMYGYAKAPGMYPPGPVFPKPPKAQVGPLFGEEQYNLDARLDRIEREIVEINRRLNILSRRVRRIENFLNIREDI